jgi:hypothetical protein
MVATLASFPKLGVFDDPEAIFQEGWFFCDAGDYARGLDYMRQAVDRGYFPVATLTRATQFDAIRNDATFRTLVTDAEAGRLRALEAFQEAGGERLLAR